MHTYFFFIFFISPIFLFFYFFFNFWGWAQLSPHGLGWTQPAQPGHWPKPVTRLGQGDTLSTVGVIKMASAQCLCN